MIPRVVVLIVAIQRRLSPMVIDSMLLPCVLSVSAV
jgi:hypothetical protein